MGYCYGVLLRGTSTAYYYVYWWMKQTIGSSSIERGFLRLWQRALISLRTKMKSATVFSYLKVRHSYLELEQIPDFPYEP